MTAHDSAEQVDEKRYELIVIGASAAGLSTVLDAVDAGLDRVLVIDTDRVEFPPALERPEVTVVHPGEVRAIKADDADRASVITDIGDFISSAVVVAPSPPRSTPTVADADDVLVVGSDEVAAVAAMDLVESAGNVVLALGGANPHRISRLTRLGLLRMEAERRLTVLWYSRPASIEPLGGHPMAYFDDGRTPDLQFDTIVDADELSAPPSIELDLSGPTRESVWWVTWHHSAPDGAQPVEAGAGWRSVRAARFPDLEETSTRPKPWRPDDAAILEELRDSHYNATITHFDRAHSDLWVLRVRPDSGSTAFDAGCYTTLGLGYWEPRSDGARDPRLDEKWDRLIRRSYSISSPIFDANGYLADPAESDELEFYIVLVPPSTERVPGLTPRLALKTPGDRMHVGRRMSGHYSLDPVQDPTATVVFLATGTGEAPHNAMVATLLRRGHTGPIVSVVSVRYRSDLAYLEQHRRLEERFPSYHYLPLATREPDEEKRYIQDVIRGDLLGERFGLHLDADTTHVFLCGNPAMIGIPSWEEDQPVFPPDEGTCQLLHERGFALDRRGVVGTVHYEKYW